MKKFFVTYAIILVASKILVFVGTLNMGLISAISGLVGIILQFPTSSIDLLLMGFKMEWLVFSIGALIIVQQIYDSYI